jgi:TRAP-type uncharacterized transport system fused permease subunit
MAVFFGLLRWNLLTACVNYWKIAMAATLPAIGYYVSVYAMVHIESLKMMSFFKELKQIPLGQITPRLHLVLPLILLVYCLAAGYSLGRAAFYSFVAGHADTETGQIIVDESQRKSYVLKRCPCSSGG